MGPVQPVRYHRLAAHLGLLPTCSLSLLRNCYPGVLFSGDGNPCNGEVKWNDGIYGPSEGELKGASYLSGVYPSRHHSTEHTDIIEVVAHPATGLIYVIYRLPGAPGSQAFRLVRPPVLGVQRLSTALDVYLESRLVAAGHIHPVTHLPLDGHVCHQALHRLRVHARKVPRVRIAIRIAVGDVEQKHEIVAAAYVKHHIGGGHHVYSSSLFVSGPAAGPLDASCRSSPDSATRTW